MTKFKYCLLFSFFYYISYSQTNIKGTIKDDKNQSLASANIVIKDFTDKIISFTYSDEKGNYFLKVNNTGQFFVSVIAMEFEEQTIAILLKKEEEKKDLDFILTPKITELKEIKIESRKSISIKKDTIIFDAKSFATGNEQVVEDLLKKIPGINIDAKGTIRVGRQEIEKVMIDGEDMFEKAYTVLTKNMPSHPIEKIELHQNYSNNKHLKGIEKSNKVALNLVLNEASKRVWFGNIKAGYGLISENCYELNSNLMNFGKKNKYYFLTNGNNIGVDNSNYFNQFTTPLDIEQAENFGKEQTAKKLLDIGSYLPIFKEKRVNFNNSETLSFNSIFTLSDKIKIKTLGFFNTDEKDFFRNSVNTITFGNISFVNNENYTNRNLQIIGFGKFDLTYAISKTKTLEYTLKLSKNSEKKRSNLWFNDDLLNEKLNTSIQLIDQKVLFSNKFKNNKAILFSGRFINEKTPQNYSINKFNLEDLFPMNANNTKQFSENKMQFISLDAHLLNKNTNGNLLELKLGNQYKKDNLETRFVLLQNENSVSFPATYQNNLMYTINDLYLVGKYNIKLGDYSFRIQNDLHQQFNHLNSFNKKNNQNLFYINPDIGINWKINKKNNLSTSYSYTINNAEVLDVYSGYVLTDYRTFNKGLDEFKQLKSSNANLNYTYGNYGGKLIANTSLLFTKNHDFFSTNSFLAPNFSQSEKIIIKNREVLSISSNIDYFFKPIKSTLKTNIGLSKTSFKNKVFDNLREVKIFNANYGFELRSGFRGIFNYHLGSKWNYNQVETIIKNEFTNNMSYVDLSFVFNDKCNIELQSERYYFGNLNKENNKYYFLDLEIRYVIKSNKLTIFLTGNNLFNTKTFKNYNITDTQISQTEYRLLPRYGLLKMEYRF